MLATGDNGGKVLLWDLDQIDLSPPSAPTTPGSPTTALDIGSIVWGLAFAPGGSQLAVSTEDGMVRVVDLTTDPPTDETVLDDDMRLRIHYLDLELDNIEGDGYSFDTLIRAQVSDRTEVWAGTEYQDLDDVENLDIVIGLGYEIWNGLTLTGSGIIFNNESGWDIGLRWYFGDRLMGRDGLFQ